MTILRTNLIAALAAFALLPACNLGPTGPGTGDDDDAADDDDDDDDGNAVATTIQALNAGEHDVDTLVSITGAIVSGTYLIDDNFVTFWVQDDLGGPGGGMTISTFVDVVEEFDPEESMYLGDIIDITGRFQLAFAEEIPRISIDRASNITITGYTDLPEAHLVEADDISGGFAAKNLWGLPVAVADVVVETTPSFDNFGVFEADGIQVDDEFYWPDVAIGDELTHLAGIITPWYGDVTLMPRWDDDVWFEPAGCGDIDESKTDTVQDVNCRRYYEGETVSIEGLTVISGETENPGNYFVQDSVNTAFGGILIYDPSGEAVPALGTIIDVTDVEYSEFLGQSELAVWDGSIDTGAAGPEIVATTVADACSVTEAHEGTLITIAEVVLGEQSEWAEGRGYYPVDGCPLVMVGSVFFDSGTAFDAVNGGVGTITNLTGVVSDRFENLLINPRSSDDWDSWVPAAN
jgi:hypothetical protein